MSKNRKRSYHFTILRGRKLYENTTNSAKTEPRKEAQPCSSKTEPRKEAQPCSSKTEPRKEAQPCSSKTEPRKKAPVRVVISAPAGFAIEVPAPVEIAVVEANRPTRAQLEKELREVRYRLNIREIAAKQGLTRKGDLGDPRDIWEDAWTVEVLKYNLRLRTPEGYPVRHPGPLSEFIRKRALHR